MHRWMPVILMLGTNDCKTQFHATPESIGAGIEALIAQVRAFDEQLPILLVSPIHLAADIAEKDPAFSADSVPISYALKSVYAAIAERETLYVFCGLGLCRAFGCRWRTSRRRGTSKTDQTDAERITTITMRKGTGKMTTKEMQEAILKWKKEQDCCILAHCYQSHEILEVADYRGRFFRD